MSNTQEAAPVAGAIVLLDAARIVPGENDRTAFDPVELQKLADSLAAHGLAQPITVRPLGDVYQIVAGERRFRASQLLGWAQVPAIIRDLDDEQAAAIMLIENIQRVDLNPIDEAKAYRKRQEQFGWTIPQIAAHGQVPASRVRQRLALLDLTWEVQSLVQSGNMPITYADSMVDLDHDRQIVAMRYFQQAKRPTALEFRALCGELLAVQNQGALFDFDAFMEQANQAAAAPVATRKRYPTSNKIPALEGKLSTGEALEHYIARLLKSDDPALLEVAAIVGTVYDGLIRANLCKPPKVSPLDGIEA